MNFGIWVLLMGTPWLTYVLEIWVSVLTVKSDLNTTFAIAVHQANIQCAGTYFTNNGKCQWHGPINSFLMPFKYTINCILSAYRSSNCALFLSDRQTVSCYSQDAMKRWIIYDLNFSLTWLSYLKSVWSLGRWWSNCWYVLLFLTSFH